MKKLTLFVLAVLFVGIALPALGDELTDAKYAAFDIQHDKWIPAKGKPITNQAICVCKDTQDCHQVARRLGLGHRVKASWRHALNGAVLEVNTRQLEKLLNDTSVSFCEQDAVVELSADQSNPPSWGLDRIDQRNLPLNNNYHYDFDGTGVHAYVIDTGTRATHNDFGGRASQDVDFTGSGNSDCNGHGTHVSGTVGGSTYGVAKNVRIHGVKVLDCGGSGTTSGVVSGIDWVTNNRINPAVANMSLGGGASTALDNAVNNSVNSGVFYAVAAGNNNSNACNFSPARASQAYTVGSTTISDARSSFSNFGTCVNIFAPGSSITSTWNTSNSATNTISGTSMASPHVAGAAALVLDENPGLSVSQVKTTLTNRATSGVISSVGSGSPNLLLFTLGGGAPPPPPPPPPPPGSCSGTLYSATANPGATLTTANFSGSGTFSGVLTCTGSIVADLDLYLDKQSCSFWGCSFSAAASSTSAACNESINHSNTSGTYRWRVVHFSGSSQGFTLCVNQG